MKRALRAVVIAILLIVCAGVANAKQIKYVGLHPIAESKDSGVCYIEAPHVHTYSPSKLDAKLMYRPHGEYLLFVGDPVAFGYDGQRTAYYGHHTVPVNVVLGVNAVADHGYEYCYLDGSHFHAYSPPLGTAFELKGGAYWYVGPLGASYEKSKPARVRINAAYAPLTYQRPVVVVTPPSAWVGAGVAASGTGVHGEIGAGIAAGVSVEVPMPTLNIDVAVGADVESRPSSRAKHRKRPSPSSRKRVRGTKRGKKAHPRHRHRRQGKRSDFRW